MLFEYVLLVIILATVESGGIWKKESMDMCEYWRQIDALNEHPECMENEERIDAAPPPPICSSSSALVQCSHDPETCPESGQACTKFDGIKCCQPVTRGVAVSEINAKAGKCPTVLGVSVLQDAMEGCWMDSACPGIQKCCMEPNPTGKTATRVCRDPLGVSSESICSLPLAIGSCNSPTARYYYDPSSGQCKTFQYSGCGGNENNFQSLAGCRATCSSNGVIGAPECPSAANVGMNCFVRHRDACNTDTDCVGRDGSATPSCCRTACGHRICHL